MAFFWSRFDRVRFIHWQLFQCPKCTTWFVINVWPKHLSSLRMDMTHLLLCENIILKFMCGRSGSLGADRATVSVMWFPVTTFRPVPTTLFGDNALSVLKTYWLWFDLESSKWRALALRFHWCHRWTITAEDVRLFACMIQWAFLPLVHCRWTLNNNIIIIKCFN